MQYKKNTYIKPLILIRAWNLIKKTPKKVFIMHDFEGWASRTHLETLEKLGLINRVDVVCYIANNKVRKRRIKGWKLGGQNG